MLPSALVPVLLAALAPGVPQAFGDTLPDVSGYPRPVPVRTVVPSPEIPRLRIDGAAVEHRAPGANQAVRVEVLGATVQPELFGEPSSGDRTFLVLLTRWENIHPRQLVDRASLEGRPDRTMGVAGFAGGGAGPGGQVAVEVAYVVPRLADHLFALVDGTAVPLDPVTGLLPRGVEPGAGLTLPALGSTAVLPLAFQVPADARDVALRFFDYTYGHLVVPIRGAVDPAEAVEAPVLDRAETDELEIAATRVAFRERYGERSAPSGWRWVVVGLHGQSRSVHGEVGDIVQLDPTEHAFLLADGGYLRYAAAGSLDEGGMIRFTPEVPQGQELAFLAPEDEGRFDLGLRLRNQVVLLELTGERPRGPPRGVATHRDGDVLEVTLFGLRREGTGWVADLGVRPLVEGRGITLRADAQLRLVSQEGEVGPDLAASEARPGRPPSPFVVPPGVAVRFELFYALAAEPVGVRYRGFRGEGMLTP